MTSGDELQSSAINYANVSEALVVNLPELLGQYEDLLKDWAGEVPGPHIVYGDILNRHIDSLLRKNDDAALRRVFAFIEVIANSSDTRVRDVVGATVCDYLGGYPDKLSRVRPHMGRATRHISDSIEEFYGRYNHPNTD